MAARQGFEPQLTDPESAVLPLDHRAKCRLSIAEEQKATRQKWLEAGLARLTKLTVTGNDCLYCMIAFTVVSEFPHCPFGD